MQKFLNLSKKLFILNSLFLLCGKFIFSQEIYYSKNIPKSLIDIAAHSLKCISVYKDKSTKEWVCKGKYIKGIEMPLPNKSYCIRYFNAIAKGKFLFSPKYNYYVSVYSSCIPYFDGIGGFSFIMDKSGEILRLYTQPYGKIAYYEPRKVISDNEILMKYSLGDAGYVYTEYAIFYPYEGTFEALISYSENCYTPYPKKYNYCFESKEFVKDYDKDGDKDILIYITLKKKKNNKDISIKNYKLIFLKKDSKYILSESSQKAVKEIEKIQKEMY